MSAKHTAGPWTLGDVVDDGPGKGADIGIDARNHKSLAMVVWRMEDEDRSQEKEANATLIAAAPELLECAEAIELGLCNGFKAAEILDENSPIRDALRAAIAKATGAQP